MYNKLPFKYEKGKFPHQILRKGKKWKKRREKLLGEKNHECEWCGIKKELQIAHKKHLYYTEYKKMFEMVMYKHELLYEQVFKLKKESFKLLYNEYEQEVVNQLEEYLYSEDVLILCKRCHFSQGKNLILCENCKEHYHKKNHHKCYECYKLEKKKNDKL